jgi:hypothetical protein
MDFKEKIILFVVIPTIIIIATILIIILLRKKSNNTESSIKNEPYIENINFYQFYLNNCNYSS